MKTSALIGAAALLASGWAAAAELPAEIVIPGTGVLPESLTSTKDGTVIIGSIGARTIFRAAPGSGTATPWIQPGVQGMQSVFGVLAHDKSDTLYVCSGVLALGPPAAGAPPPPQSSLYTFGLKSGAYKGHFALPHPNSACNDIAVDGKGNAYVTDTTNMQVGQLKKGASKIEVWAGAGGEFGPAGGILDGIAVLKDRVFVNALATSKLFAVNIDKGAKAGKVTEIKLDVPLDRPDGMRSYGPTGLLVAEGGGGGKLGGVRIDGDTGIHVIIKEGFPDGPAAVTVVKDKAYVVEAQFASMRAAPGTPAKPFKATAVQIGTLNRSFSP